MFQSEEDNGLPQHDNISGPGMVMNGVTTSIPKLKELIRESFILAANLRFAGVKLQADTNLADYR